VFSDLSRIREARMLELKQEFANQQRFRALGHGEYSEISQVNKNRVLCINIG
jgi:hypothetical protein